MPPTYTPPPSVPDDINEDISDEEIAFLEGEDYEVVNEPDQDLGGYEDDASDMEDLAPQQDDCKFLLKKHNGKSEFNNKSEDFYKKIPGTPNWPELR
ncbi:unnamed protein product [Dibothriocephalus latus]|uniref:Uncharacterized protein n=1 Tax=Dibothriocephalus latus TaxID=60516 RepID=A0A3P7LU86_DIBLA|nr:unnamed protein product [Dibothriocephalus latus]